MLQKVVDSAASAAPRRQIGVGGDEDPRDDRVDGLDHNRVLLLVLVFEHVVDERQHGGAQLGDIIAAAQRNGQIQNRSASESARCASQCRH